jgi:hypothetical protein
MAGGGAERSRAAGTALGFAIAGLAACWNPLAAPFGLVVGAGAAVLAIRALRLRLGRRGVAWAALLLGGLSALAGAAVLLSSAGVLDPRTGGQAIVAPRSPVEVKALLDEAERKTAPSRERAVRELGNHAGEPMDGGVPSASRSTDGAMDGGGVTPGAPAHSADR